MLYKIKNYKKIHNMNNVCYYRIILLDIKLSIYYIEAIKKGQRPFFILHHAESNDDAG